MEGSNTEPGVYSIKTLRQIHGEEFEAVFEFDSDTQDGLSESDIRTLELLKSENLLIIGNEDDSPEPEANSQERSHSLSRFKDVLENYTRNAYVEIRENTAETTQIDDQIIEDKEEQFTKQGEDQILQRRRKIQRNSETRKSKKNIKVRCPTPIPQDPESDTEEKDTCTKEEDTNFGVESHSSPQEEENLRYSEHLEGSEMRDIQTDDCSATLINDDGEDKRKEDIKQQSDEECDEFGEKKCIIELSRPCDQGEETLTERAIDLNIIEEVSHTESDEKVGEKEIITIEEKGEELQILASEEKGEDLEVVDNDEIDTDFKVITFEEKEAQQEELVDASKVESDEDLELVSLKAKEEDVEVITIEEKEEIIEINDNEEKGEVITTEGEEEHFEVANEEEQKEMEDANKEERDEELEIVKVDEIEKKLIDEVVTKEEEDLEMISKEDHSEYYALKKESSVTLDEGIEFKLFLIGVLLVFLAMFNWYFSSDDGQQELENEIIKKIARKIVKAKADGVLEESVKMDYNLNAN